MKIVYVVTDKETTGLPDEDTRHRAYSWAYRMVLVDYASRTFVKGGLFHRWIDPGVPDLIVSEYTLNSQSWKDFCDTRMFEPHHVLNPLKAYEEFAEYVTAMKSDGFEPFQVGANPAFDRQFIDQYQTESEIPHNLHHRKIDTDMVAMLALGAVHPLGLEESIQRLYDKPCFKQLHNAECDVDLCTKILEDFVIKPLLCPQGKHLDPQVQQIIASNV